MDYDNIIPIGDHCAISLILNDLHLRKMSYPFDWTSLNGGKSGELHKTNIMINCELINELKTDELDNVVNKYIGNAFDSPLNDRTNANNIFFPHDEGEKNDIFQKYKRRFGRLKTHLYNKNIFMLVTRHCYIDEMEFNKITKILLSYNHNSKIIFISGINHEYFSENKEKYANVIFKHIYYDITQFYNYDYTHFRPEIKKYVKTIFQS